MRFGVPFDSVDGEVALGREAAHSRARILHAGGDSTGAHIELTLSDVARHSSVTILEHSQALEIVVEDGGAVGVIALDARTNATRGRSAAATSSSRPAAAASSIRVSTNPPVATGDGVALAYRAGAEIMDMEFIQFHPTALRLPGVPVFLISEAVRGEGALLINADGERFMPRLRRARRAGAARHRRARHRLARWRARSTDRVYLDVTHLPPERTAARFPQIMRYCRQHGLDITKEPIPVSPAAHYMMGGVRTNAWGETNMRNLYACGETACTGVHGANRLASNSLLETVVFAKRDHRAHAGAAAPARSRRSTARDRLPETGAEQHKAGVYRARARRSPASERRPALCPSPSGRSASRTCRR